MVYIYNHEHSINFASINNDVFILVVGPRHVVLRQEIKIYTRIIAKVISDIVHFEIIERNILFVIEAECNDQLIIIFLFEKVVGTCWIDVVNLLHGACFDVKLVQVVQTLNRVIFFMCTTLDVDQIPTISRNAGHVP